MNKFSVGRGDHEFDPRLVIRSVGRRHIGIGRQPNTLDTQKIVKVFTSRHCLESDRRDVLGSDIVEAGEVIEDQRRILIGNIVSC
jgi:hypothetical protein